MPLRWFGLRLCPLLNLFARWLLRGTLVEAGGGSDSACGSQQAPSEKKEPPNSSWDFLGIPWDPKEAPRKAFWEALGLPWDRLGPTWDYSLTLRVVAVDPNIL